MNVTTFEPKDLSLEETNKKDQADALPPKPSQTPRLVGRNVSIIILSVVMIVPLVEIALVICEGIKKRIWGANIEELTVIVRSKFSETLVVKLESQGLLKSKDLCKNLANCSDTEKKIIEYVNTTFDPRAEDLHHILRGGHIRLEDGGKTYTKWELHTEKNLRVSSHPSVGPQYGIRGPLVSEFLFGKVTVEDESTQVVRTYTWFQLENHPTKIGHIVRHMIDYIKYKRSGENQGPYGSSPATDRNPIILKMISVASAS